MELAEPIESINQQLIDLFGLDTSSGQPMFRIVWSEDQFEKRLTDRSDKGLVLPTSVIKLLPKYKQWIKERFVLERLIIVPEVNIQELAGIKLSYEPLWVFQGRNDEYVPPTLWGSKFVIDTLYAAMGKQSLVRYVDEEAKHPIETREKRIEQLTEELFGDESNILGRTVTGEAIVVPQSYETTQKGS
jgi:hypothetical protein